MHIANLGSSDGRARLAERRVGYLWFSIYLYTNAF